MEIKKINIESKINCNYSTINEIAYSVLKNLIITCKFKGGDRL